MKRWIVTSILLLLTACTNQLVGHYLSTDMDVMTLQTRYQTPLNASLKQQRHTLTAFLNANRDKVHAGVVTLHWQGKQGAAMKKLAKQWLIAEGVPVANIHEHAGSPVGFELLIDQGRVVLPLCASARIERFEKIPANCHVESARWQSMVYPQRNIPPEER